MNPKPTLTAAHVAEARDALHQAYRMLMKGERAHIIDRVDVATRCSLAAQDLETYCLDQIEVWLAGDGY